MDMGTTSYPCYELFVIRIDSISSVYVWLCMCPCKSMLCCPQYLFGSVRSLHAAPTTYFLTYVYKGSPSKKTFHRGLERVEMDKLQNKLPHIPIHKFLPKRQNFFIEKNSKLNIWFRYQSKSVCEFKILLASLL